ncbi:MAG: hypothetical protein RLZZ401_1190, partial [Pseudomonadota bacterium]
MKSSQCFFFRYLALSTAVVVTSAFAGVVTGTGSAGGGTLGGTSANQLVVNADGIGHQLIVPYFSAQNGNTTLLSIVNLDNLNGKAVKVRFRG